MTFIIAFLWENKNGKAYMENSIKKKINIYNVIGQNIKRIRKEKGLTGFELAKRCNLSHGYLKNLEAKNVDASISIETLALVADVLKVDISEFLKY